MKRLYFIPCLIVFIGCTITSTKTFMPELKHEIPAILANIHGIVEFETIGINGVQTTVDDERVRELDISVINAKGVPENMFGLRDLAQKIAKEIKSELVNRGEFDVIKVYFIDQVSNGNINTNSSKEVSFTAKEL